MSDSDKTPFTDFGKLVPGFDFLQNLTRQASASPPPGMPGMAQLGGWVAPTLNVEELDKRIAELKAVQFWLDQNATALKATIQALEVQKMTLVALQGMNVNMSEMAQAFTARMPTAAAAPAPSPAAPAAVTEPVKEPAPAPEAAAAGNSQPKTAAASGGVDPLQWWGALTQQFQSIAQSAMKEAAARKPTEAALRPGKPAVKMPSKTPAKSSAKAKPKAKPGASAKAPSPAPARKAAPRSR